MENECLNVEVLYKARNNATKCINQSLNVVGENLGFKFRLSMHVARHTCAVFALNNGLSMSVVSCLLGHDSTDIVENVYARFLPKPSPPNSTYLIPNYQTYLFKDTRD